MKTKLFGLSLFALTSLAVIVLPMRQSTGAIQPAVIEHPLPTSTASKIEVVFVLDTTGSMSGLIEAAKEKIWSIASSLAQAESAPEIRLGLVAYRDRGDAYVTRVTPLSSDLDSVYATLMDYRAGGGGDTPESVNQALHDALHRIAWSDEQEAYQAVFLVGDAPPHMDYQDEPRYPQIIADARSRGIVVNTIQAGAAKATAVEWQKWLHWVTASISGSTSPPEVPSRSPRRTMKNWPAFPKNWTARACITVMAKRVRRRRQNWPRRANCTMPPRPHRAHVVRYSTVRTAARPTCSATTNWLTTSPAAGSTWTR